MGAGARRTIRVDRLWEALPARLRFATPLDDGQLFDFCNANPGLRVERTRRGEIVVMSPAGPESARRNASLLYQHVGWSERDGTGVVFDSSAGFTLPNSAMRGPDASWARVARWEAAPRQKRGFTRFVPDFVAEILSPSDRVATAERKMQEYVDNGVRLGWLIDPKRRSVKVYRPGRPPERFEDPPTVSGDPDLPGFVLDLSRIW